MNLTIKVKAKVDWTGLKRSVHKMNIKNIGHAAALVRKFSARSIRYRKNKHKASPVGTPPFTHDSRVSPYRYAPLRKSIKYVVEKENELAVVGVSYSGLLDIGYAHEKGGWYKMKRAKTAMYYKKRPFMKPALDKNSPSFPRLWEGSLRK